MKKTWTAACLLTLLLCGCQSQAAYLKPYTAYTSAVSSDSSALLQAQTAGTIGTEHAVVSVSDNDDNIYASELTGVDATEIFLTGTDDNTLIASSNVFHEMPMASLTKIMTALVALKYGPSMDEMITLTEDMYVTVDDAQVCGYQAGDVISMKDLFYSMMVYSGNDAANAVAIATAGDITSFCDMMNSEAQALGATHTNFVTPHGLDDPNHYSTAYDLYLIFTECLKYDTFRDAMNNSSWTVSIQRGEETVRQTYESTDLYLVGTKTPPDGITVLGGKTGTTESAGLCLILYSEDDAGKGYISVLLGCEDKDTLYASMNNLLALTGN